MISMIMVLNQKGDIMISRQYRYVGFSFPFFYNHNNGWIIGWLDYAWRESRKNYVYETTTLLFL